mgnify:CR=1 FL=1
MPLTLKDKSVLAEPIQWSIFFRDTYEGGGGLGDPDLIATMVRSSADVFAWLKSLGVEFDPALYEAYTGVYPRAHRTIQARSGMAYSRALMRRARKLGVEVRYRQRVEALVMHNGRVLGVELTDMDADSPQHKTLMAQVGGHCLRRFRRQSSDACSVGTMDFHGFGDYIQPGAN